VTGPDRPGRLVAVVGTGTDVGKTWWSARVLAGLRAGGVAVAARKPAQSFAPEELGHTDAELLAAATGEDPAAVCPRARWYPVPMAPPMAADAAGRPEPTLAALLELAWPAPRVGVGLVETAGGVRSPLAVDGDGLDLVGALDPDVVLLVADAGLGTINAVRLTAAAVAPRPTVVALNRWRAGDDLHRRNRAWLAGVDGLDVVVDPAELVARWSR
jgi:dethiobiotin synthetase